ncbi:MAG: mitochondrial fission ELM1 family protein [Inquilinaceae bacterium]
MEVQCVGLAEALGVTPVVKRVHLRQPWRLLSPYFRIGIGHAAGPSGDAIAPPWPDLLIGSGRQAVVPALAVKHGSDGHTILVQIQDPAIDPANFDLVIVPRHDRLRGGNVVTTLGSIHRVTPDRLAQEAAHHAARLAFLPRPRVAVLIGGANGVFRLGLSQTARIADSLAALARDGGAGLMITPSRRTGADNEALLRDRLAGLPAEIWDGTGENPYFGYLGLADAILCTGDSVNMVSEAAATGKPVHIIDLEGGSDKFAAFHASMRAAGITRPFTGALETWSYDVPDDTAQAAAAVQRRLAAQTAPSPPLKSPPLARTS